MKHIETLEYLERLRIFGSNYGLERTEKLLEKLGNPHKKIKLIHIAGTNGKGSTSSILGNILISHGYKVGFFNSPHLEDIEETIRINNENIKEEEFIELINEIKIYVDEIIEEGFNHPTEFEVLTCIMFLYLYREKVDFGIIEVGLGGRLDSTNVINPIMSIITSISLDHINILGDNIKEITKEKCGIIKKNIPVVTYIQKDEVLEVIIEKASLMNSNLIISNPDNFKFINVEFNDKIYQEVSFKFNEKEEILKLPLLGEHQITNLSLAISAIMELNSLNYIDLNIEKLKLGVFNTKWRGRLEVINKKPLIVLDGAHNIEGIEVLKRNINKYFKFNNLYLIIGILKDKEVEKMVKVITPMAKEVYTVMPNSIRAEKAEALKEIIKKYNDNVEAFEDYNKAIEVVLSKANKKDLILVCGSLYMIGNIRSLFDNFI